MPITSRENWLRFLRGEKPEWMPVYSETQAISPDIVPDNVARGFLTQKNPFPESQYGGPDMYGVPWVYEKIAGGSMEDPNVPPILTDVTKWREIIRFPDIDSWDWEGAKRRNEGLLVPDRLTTTVIYTGFFERLISFMGFEAAAMAMIDEDVEEDLRALLDGLADANIDLIAHYKKYFDVDLVYLHDDWGSQMAPFFSLQTVRDMLVPYMRRVADYCHANGIFFELHSCGHNDILVPAMIEAHIDSWCGQPMCDKYALWEQYGDRIAIGMSFYGKTKEELPQAFDEMLDRVKDGICEKRMYVRDRILTFAPELHDYLVEKSKGLYAK